MFVVCLSSSLVCFVCAVLLCSFFFVFGVYVLCVVWCVDVCYFVGLSCVYASLLSCGFVCYGLNAFPVCDCSLCVPSLRCSSIIV